jgi:Tfp pilus assembly protein PilO
MRSRTIYSVLVVVALVTIVIASHTSEGQSKRREKLREQKEMREKFSPMSTSKVVVDSYNHRKY